ARGRVLRVLPPCELQRGAGSEARDRYGRGGRSADRGDAGHGPAALIDVDLDSPVVDRRDAEEAGQIVEMAMAVDRQGGVLGGHGGAGGVDEAEPYRGAIDAAGLRECERGGDVRSGANAEQRLRGANA